MMDRPKNMKIADDTTLLANPARWRHRRAGTVADAEGLRSRRGSEVNVRSGNRLRGKVQGHKAGSTPWRSARTAPWYATAGFDGMVRLYDATGDLKKGVRACPTGAGIRRTKAMKIMWDRRSPCVVCQPDSGEARQTTRGDGLSHLGAQ
jgi:hypothetical protein